MVIAPELIAPELIALGLIASGLIERARRLVSRRKPDFHRHFPPLAKGLVNATDRIQSRRSFLCSVLPYQKRFISMWNQFGRWALR
jgi:hypothetical protein